MSDIILNPSFSGNFEDNYSILSSSLDGSVLFTSQHNSFSPLSGIAAKTTACLEPAAITSLDFDRESRYFLATSSIGGLWTFDDQPPVF